MSVLFRRFPNYGKFTTQLLFKDVEKQLIFKHVSTNTAGNVKSPRGFIKLSLVGLSVGALVGTGFSIHKNNKTTTHIINEETTIPPLKEIPKIPPTRKMVYPGSPQGLKLTLYQYQTCPFCCKVRAYLDYYGISYDVVEVDAVLRQSIKWSPYKKVPILVAEIEEGYQPMNDSSMIISALQSYLQDKGGSITEIVKCYPSISYEEDGSKKVDIMNKYFIMYNGINPNRTKEEMEEERKWRKWVDGVLVHTLSPNVYRTPEQAFQAFNWFSDTGEWDKHFPAWERYMMVYVGAVAMWLISKRLKAKYNLKEDVRLSLYDECNKFAKAIHLKGTSFMGGNEPNLADLSVYGVLSSIEGCDAFRDLLEYSKIKNWYLLMKDTVQNHRGMSFG
ncbi:prostaglandin E synthase 2 [Onthophagus taurus]|uniref:prostaglandin E synthase 2 n=1 Tax=Onthophagus taurus TaxID=166361 RepID=UPI0039BE4791